VRECGILLKDRHALTAGCTESTLARRRVADLGTHYST
jgi:hypothetical protein